MSDWPVEANMETDGLLPGIRATQGHLNAELDALRTIAEQLAEALSETRDMNPHRCPACGMGGRRVHYVGCSLAAALEAWEAYRKNDGGGYANGKG